MDSLISPLSSLAILSLFIGENSTKRIDAKPHCIQITETDYCIPKNPLKKDEFVNIKRENNQYIILNLPGRLPLGTGYTCLFIIFHEFRFMQAFHLS